MLFTVIPFLVPLIIYFLAPSFVERLKKRRVHSKMLLIIACLLFCVSWYLPSPLIYGQNTAFTTHFVGGGLFCGFFWLFIKRELRWKSSWIIEMLSLYAFVSALGVANELFELWVSQMGLIDLNGADTWWDLLANTLGGFMFWLGYCAYKPFMKGK